jgi:hypothetical protein
MGVNEIDLLQAARSEDLAYEQIASLTVLGEHERKIVDTLKQSGAHLVQGARGVGKSMLLRQAEIEMDHEFASARQLAIYVNFKTSTLLEGVKADQRDAFQIWVGAKLLQSMYDKLTALNLMGPSGVADPYLRIFGVHSVEGMRLVIQDKIHKLQKLAHSLDKKRLIAELGADFLDKASDISFLHEIIKEIARDFKLSRVVFRFDEAAHTFIPSQQEIFFEIFKLLHGGHVSVKAAVYPSVTSYGRNFEVGHDAIVISMDRFEAGATGRSANRKIFRDILDKRLPRTGRVRKEIFQKGYLLDQIIDLATGNPRAFFHLLNRVYDKGFTDRALVLATQEYVDEELLPYHRNLTKRLPKFARHVTVGLNLLLGYLIPEIRKKNYREKKTPYQSAFFTTQRDLSPNLKLALDILCYSGILSGHGTVKTARSTGRRYMVHLAIMFTEKAFATSNFPEAMKSLSLTDYREFSSSDPEIDQYLKDLKTSSISCVKCSAEAAPNAKFCAHCGTPIEPISIISGLLDEPVSNMSVSARISARISTQFPRVGDVIDAAREEIMKIRYLKDVRSRMIKNAAEEFISG